MTINPFSFTPESRYHNLPPSTVKMNLSYNPTTMITVLAELAGVILRAA